METVISVFPVKEEPELNILSDGDDDTGYDNDYNNGEDEENVTILHYFHLIIRLVLYFQ